MDESAKITVDDLSNLEGEELNKALGWEKVSHHRIPTTQRKLHHRKFALEYIATGFDGDKALANAGYLAKTQNGRRVRATQLLKHPDVQEVLQEEFQKFAMSAAEVIYRLSQHASGTWSYFLNDKGEVDLSTDEAKAHLYLIKEIDQDQVKIPGRKEEEDDKTC